MTDIGFVQSTARPSFRGKLATFKWTDERDEQLKTLWAQGLSATVIAEQMGLTSRNAPLGRLHRLKHEKGATGLDRRAPAHAPRSRKPRGDCGGGAVKSISAKKERGGQNNGLNLNTPRPRINFAEPAPVDNVIPAPQRRTLLELDSSCCHWPIGDPCDRGFFFCGGPALTGYPYCAYHSRVAYLPPNSRRGHMRDFY